MYTRIGDISSGGVALQGNGATTTHHIGSHDIGEFVKIEFSVEDLAFDIASNFCLKKIEWTDNLNQESLVLGEEYLGYGVFLVKDGNPFVGTIESVTLHDPTKKGCGGKGCGPCQGDCDSDDHCPDGFICVRNQRPAGCTGPEPSPNWDYCGATSSDGSPLQKTNFESFHFQEAPWMDGLYLPSTPYRFEVNRMASDKGTIIDLVIRTCASDDAFTLKDDSGFQVSISGRNMDGVFSSSEKLPLSTGKQFLAGENRHYSLAIPSQFSETNVLTFSIEGIGNDDMTCIDMVEVNGKRAYLTETYLSTPGSNCEGLDAECPSILFAVLTWPICGIEIMSTRTEGTVESESNERLIAAKCSNPNRLFETECAVSEERSTTTSYETTVEISTSRSTSRSNSLSRSAGGSATTTTGWSFQSETVLLFISYIVFLFGYIRIRVILQGLQIGNDASPVKATQKLKIGSSGSASISSTWSGSSSSSWTDGTEDSTANGDSNSTSSSSSVSCSGSVSVPPLHSVSYTVTMANAIVELTTYSDIRMTKCSTAFQDALDDDSLYIYLYDVPGASRSVSGDSCSVEYAIAEYAPAPMACDEATKMTNVELGTQSYAPICNRGSPAKWEPCQCGFGDYRSEANCICVHNDSGVPLANDNGFSAAVIDTSDASSYDHYSDWCEEHCPNSYYPGIVQKMGISAASSDIVTMLLPDPECEGPSCHGSNSSLNTQFDYMDSESMATLIYLAMAALCAVFVVSTLAAAAILIFVCGKLCPPYRKSQMIAVDHSDCV